MALTEIKTKSEHYFVDENGHQQGEYKSWWESGNPCVYCHFLNGNLHGEHKTWYDNRNPVEYCYYLNGKKHGEYKSWCSNGNQIRHIMYVNGTKICDLDSLSEEDKILLSLKYGVTNWL